MPGISPLKGRGPRGRWLTANPTSTEMLVVDSSGDVSSQPIPGEIPTERPTKLLITSFGESNSGGVAVSEDAEPWELAPRPELQMWNVLTEVFEDLDLGTNNNLDHFALNPGTHGWELGLANKVKQGYFRDCDVYYLQTGQGGANTGFWVENSIYWEKFLERTAGAKAAIGEGCQYVVWITIGINDIISGTPAATYKADMIEIIDRIKVELPGCKVFFCKLMTYEVAPYSTAYQAYNDAIQEIADGDADIEAISVTDPELSYNFPHWDYAGMKGLAARLVEATTKLFGFPRVIDEVIQTYAAPLDTPKFTGTVEITGASQDSAPTPLYGLHSTGGGGSNSTSVGVHATAGSASVQIALQTGTGYIDFHGALVMNGSPIIDVGNSAVGGTYTAAAGSLKIQDRTSGNAAGQGGGILFTGDTYSQGNRDASAFARVRGVKENSTYANGLGKLTLGTQASSAITPDGTTIVDWIELSSAGHLFLKNTSAPATPTGGVVIYAEDGALKCKGSSGTVTVLGSA